MGVDIFLAVGAGVAVKQMFDPIEQAASPGAENYGVDLGAVFHQNPQQFGQVGRAPVARNEAFGKTDVT